MTYNQGDFVHLHRDWQTRDQKHGGILLSEELSPGELFKRLERAARLLSPETARNQLMRLPLFASEEQAQALVTGLSSPPSG